MIQKLDKMFLLKWILVGCGGFLVSQYIGLILIGALFPGVNPQALIGSPFYWVIFGLTFGFSQWVILQDHIPLSRSWMLYSVIGYFAAQLLIKILALIGVVIAGIPAFIVGGIVVSAAQYLFLRQRFIKTGWWMLASTLSWSLSQKLLITCDSLHQVIGLLVFPVITGVILAWFFQNPLQAKNAA